MTPGTRMLPALVMTLAIACPFVPPAAAHDWYDAECCSGHDCEPVSAVTFVAGKPGGLPVMTVTTSHGTRPRTPDTKIRESRDSRMHACIFRGRLICLYMPPGM